MLICHDWKLVFLHVPKCAGTSIRRLLEEEAPLGSAISFFDFEYNHILKRHVDLAHLPLMDLRHYAEWKLLEDYHTVAVIRHPYSRLVSACREFYRQKSRETEIQMRSHPPSPEQLLDYLRALPAALDAHDLRYVHAFPIVWFTHYGSEPMVDTLLNCCRLLEDLEEFRKLGILPQQVIDQLLTVSPQAPQPSAPDLSQLAADPNLQAMANLLYQEDFNTFGFSRMNAHFNDLVLQQIVDQSLGTSASHCISCLGLALQVRWYWGRDSNRIPPHMKELRSATGQRTGRPKS
jgi:hypothetical protein